MGDTNADSANICITDQQDKHATRWTKRNQGQKSIYKVGWKT